jgi:hypothetical protein
MSFKITAESDLWESLIAKVNGTFTLAIYLSIITLVKQNVLTNLEIMQYQYWASNKYWKTATKPLRFWLLNKQFGQTCKNSLHQNLPTQTAKVFSNLEIMQYQYPASNQYWKTATEPLRFWLLKKQLGQACKILFTKTCPLKLPKCSAI